MTRDKSRGLRHVFRWKENDIGSQNFLNWFVHEQIEEEESSLKILEKLKIIKTNLSALSLLDKELSTRILSLPKE